MPNLPVPSARRFVGLLALIALLVAACAPGAAPAPTAAPAPAAQKPAPTQAPAKPAAQPAAKAETKPAAKPATDYPTKPVTLIIPWAAGGDTDVAMRIIAKAVEKHLGQPIVIQNVTGGGGTVGARQAMGGKADGYTLFSGHESMSVSQHTGVVDFGVANFEPIALIVSTPEFMVTHPGTPWETAKDVIEDAEKNPEKFTWGATFGSTSHIFPVAVMKDTGVKFKLVSYEGTAPRVTALLGGQLDVIGSPLATATEHVKAGKMRLLGFAGDERHRDAKDVPTLKEQGINFTWSTSRGWFAPKGTPEAVVLKVEDAIRKAVQDAEVKQQIEVEQGSELTFLDHKAYAERLKTQDGEIRQLVEEMGMKRQ